MTFGKCISDARKALKLSQKDIAQLIMKDDGEAISPQYLNDIEHDRRNPPSADMIEQLASKLRLESDFLYYLAGKLTEDMIKKNANPEKVVEAYRAFRRVLKEK